MNFMQGFNRKHLNKISNNFDNSICQQDASLWTFNVKHALNYYLYLLQGKNVSLPEGKTFQDELNSSILALSQYIRNMFHILTPHAKQELSKHLSGKFKKTNEINK